jgi:hypothetical protein
MAGLECDRCHKPIDDNDRTKDGLAECKECGLVFDLLHAPLAVDVPISAAPPSTEPVPSRRPIGRKRPQVKIPERFDVTFEDMEPLPLKPSAIKSMMKQLPYREAAQDMMLTAKRKSRPHARAFIRIKPAKVALTPWFLALVVVPVIGLGLLVVLDILRRRDLVGTLGICLGAFVLLRVFMLLRAALNTTTIQLRDGLLRISVAPLSFSRHTILADDIAQIWTRRTKSEHGDEEVSTFSVEMSLSNGATHVLMENLETAEQALYIEQELEYALGLIDVAVTEPGGLVGVEEAEVEDQPAAEKQAAEEEADEVERKEAVRM